MLDHRLAEFAAFQEFRFGAFGAHQSLEIVRDRFGADGSGHSFDDQIGRLGPTHIPQHHLTGEDHAAGVDLVLIGVLGGGAVGGFENGVAGVVVEIAARGDADPADLSSQGVGNVIAVEVQRGDDVEVFGAGEHLLQGDVGDGVFDENLAAGER